MNLKYYKQKTVYTCGPAAMRMVLSSLGIKVSEEKLAKLLSANKIRGTYHKYFPEVAEKYKLKHFSEENGTIKDLRRFHKEGWAIIVCLIDRAFYPHENFDHYAVLKKIDKRHVYLLDPFFGENERYELADFNKRWESSKRYEGDVKWFFAVKK